MQRPVLVEVSLVCMVTIVGCRSTHMMRLLLYLCDIHGAKYSLRPIRPCVIVGILFLALLLWHGLSPETC